MDLTLLGYDGGFFFLPVPGSTDGLAEQIDVSLYIELHSTALRRHLPSLMEEMSSAMPETSLLDDGSCTFDILLERGHPDAPRTSNVPYL